MSRIFEDRVNALTKKIHLEPKHDVKFMIAVAGNGIDGVAELMRHGNGSNTLIGQHLLYREKMTHRYLGYAPGRKPEKLVSGAVARELAMTAYVEARDLASHSEFGSDLFAGIGCTSALVKPEGEREGREHLIFVAVQRPSYTKSIKITLKHGRRREEEEWVAGMAIYKEIASIRGFEDEANKLWDIIAYPGDQVSSEEKSTEVGTSYLGGVYDVLHGKRDYVYRHLNHQESITGPVACLSGSFNPLHDGHKQMGIIAAQKLGMPTVFELCVRPMDKAPLDYIEIDRRVSQFDADGLPVMLTNATRFVQKSRLLPHGSVFVAGMDTIARLISPHYYDNGYAGVQQAMDVFLDNGNRFLCFSRRQDGHVSRLRDPDFDLGIYTSMFIEVPPEEFILDISSTALRKTDPSVL